MAEQNHTWEFLYFYQTRFQRENQLEPCPAFIGVCFNPQNYLRNYVIDGYTLLVHCHVSEHLRHKARALQVQPEVPVKDPGVTPALCHVFHELPGGEVLAKPLDNHLSLVLSFRRYQVDTNQNFGPSVDDQAVSLSDDGTTIIIDFFSLSLLLVRASLCRRLADQTMVPL